MDAKELLAGIEAAARAAGRIMLEAEDILSGRGHIFSAHLKETRPGVYRNLMFGEGQVDFTSALNAFKAAGVSRFNAEFWYGGGDPAAELEAAHSFLKEKLDAVFRINDNK